MGSVRRRTDPVCGKNCSIVQYIAAPQERHDCA
jgi:hypothetical protein